MPERSHQQQLIADALAREIRSHGSIAFARFMEVALYHPEAGYYRSGRDVFGSGGDYYTAEQLQPVFGETIAAYVADAKNTLPGGSPFTVFELGAGRGDMQAALASFNYQPYDWDRGRLPAHLSGVVLAHEFFDALPVHLLRRHGTRWLEMSVTQQEEKFVFTTGEPIRDERLLLYIERFGDAIPDGGLLEASPAVADWINRLGSLVRDGYVAVIDYGYDAPELRRFPYGTLMSFGHHSASDAILEAPGTRDLTAHVNFTFLCEQAVHAGFTVETSQTLSSWAAVLWQQHDFERRWQEADMRWRLQWKQLVFGLGETFRVLILRKVG